MEYTINFLNMLVIILSSALFSISLFLEDRKSVFRAFLVSFISFISTIIINNFPPIISDKKIVWLFGFIVYGVVLLFLINKNIKTIPVIIYVLILSLLIHNAPTNTIVFGNFTSLHLAIALAIILYLVILKFVKNEKFILKSIVLLMLSAVILFVFEEIMFLIFINTILIVLLYLSYSKAKEEQENSKNKLLNRLQNLEKNFSDEVRKAVNIQTFHYREVQEKMSQVNKIDNLTKALNKKATENLIEELIANDKTKQFSIIFFDLDNFKTLNDTLGHIQGDLSLKQLSSIARNSIRETDSVGRIGGDEFMIILPSASLNTAKIIAERFRENVEKDTDPKFTVSVGLATYPHDGESLKELVETGDNGLYASKEKGRNAVSYHNKKTNIKF